MELVILGKISECRIDGWHRTTMNARKHFWIAGAQRLRIAHIEGVNLRAGFTPDPYRVPISSGGTINTDTLSRDCRDWMANPSDFVVNYAAGSFNLSFSSTSPAETTLLVQAPDGRFYCADDGGAGLNPISGRCTVGGGSCTNGVYAQSTLSISELGRQ